MFGFLGLPRHVFHVTVILGFATGFFLWNEPLKHFARENFSDSNQLGTNVCLCHYITDSYRKVINE